MNITPLTQTIANISVGLAALIYVLPLQLMVFAITQKRNGQTDHGAGVFVVAAFLGIMWLLLMVGLCCVIASGGLEDWTRARGWLYVLAFGATFSMLTLSFAIFEFPNHPNVFTRWIGRVPFYVFPAATMLFTVATLNPRFASTLPLLPARWAWLLCAGVSLALCGGYLGYRFAVPVLGRVVGLGTFWLRRGPTDQEILVKIATLDPHRQFDDLLHYASQYQDRVVREAATIRLRSRPDFADALASILTSRSPEYGLDFLPSATFSKEEQQRLALPARTALKGFIRDVPGPNYISSDRRKQLLKWGRETFPLIGKKFSDTDVDFSQILPKLERNLEPNTNHRP